jgi:hypothetical protein
MTHRKQRKQDSLQEARQPWTQTDDALYNLIRRLVTRDWRNRWQGADEDIVQDTYLEAVLVIQQASADSQDGTTDRSSLERTVEQAIDRLRRRKHLRPVAADWSKRADWGREIFLRQTHTELPEARLQRAEFWERVQSVLDQMDPGSAFVLRQEVSAMRAKTNQMPDELRAAALEITVGAFRKRRQRAWAKFRQLWGEFGSDGNC